MCYNVHGIMTWKENSHVALYCFAEGRRALFTESILRGLLAAFLDWPHLKPYETYILEANRVPDDMLRDVCCIPLHDYPYRHLIVHGWDAAYRSLGNDGVSERILALAKTVCKQKSTSEALAFLRSCLPTIQPIIDPAWAQYLAAFPVIE